MRIAIFGSGALGGYFGARLLKAGHDVRFLARGAQLSALRTNGLRVSSALGDVRLPPLPATDDPQDIGPVDAVLIVVKLQDTTAVVDRLGPLLAKDTVVVSLQNGVEGPQMLAERAGREQVLGGVAYIFAHVADPGHVVHSGSLAKLVLGELDGIRRAHTSAFHKALIDAGIDAELVDDIHSRIWEKFVLLSALSSVTALARLSIGEVLADAQCASLFRDALQETARVGWCECPALSKEIVQKQWAFANSLPTSMRASMLDDLERAKPLELEHLAGAVVRLARHHGLDAPTHDVAYRALHPFMGGRKPAGLVVGRPSING